MAKVTYDDLSGTTTPVTTNPYDGLIQACNNDPKQIQARYDLHRRTRNEQQREKILSPNFQGWILDEVLTKLDGPQKDPDFVDPRNCLVFWARPPQKIKNLIEIIQQRLKHVAPALWLMPLPNLHMTAIEVTHSLTSPEIDALVHTLTPASKTIADLPSTPGSRAHLIKPQLSFDAAALALSFVPAAFETLPLPNSNPDVLRQASDPTFTYHHLRRTLHAMISATGIPISSRYIVPSAHLTIARFNCPNPFDPANQLDPDAGRSIAKRKLLMREVESINQWLEAQFWPDLTTHRSGGGQETRGQTVDADAESKAKLELELSGQWVVGEGKGLDFRKGALWYGGGETVYLGKAIEE